MEERGISAIQMYEMPFSSIGRPDICLFSFGRQRRHQAIILFNFLLSSLRARFDFGNTTTTMYVGTFYTHYLGLANRKVNSVVCTNSFAVSYFAALNHIKAPSPMDHVQFACSALFVNIFILIYYLKR